MKNIKLTMAFKRAREVIGDSSNLTLQQVRQVYRQCIAGGVVIVNCKCIVSGAGIRLS